MIFEGENFKIMDKELFDSILIDRKKEETYLYHFIIVKYRANNNIKTIKIDQVKDLKKLENKDILFIYYIKKIHYYTGSGNDFDELGEPFHIFNIGHFFIGGFIDMTDEEKEQTQRVFKEYENNYDNLEFPFTKEKFLSLNKSVFNF